MFERSRKRALVNGRSSISIVCFFICGGKFLISLHFIYCLRSVVALMYVLLYWVSWNSFIIEHLVDSIDDHSIGMRRNELTICAFYLSSHLLLDGNRSLLNNDSRLDPTRANLDFAG